MKASIGSMGIAALLLSQQVFAAGFDCALSTLKPTEKSICSNQYLSSLDNSMNKFFKVALDGSYARGALLASQKKWIAERNSCNADAECIKNSYLERNDFLAKAGKFTPVREAFTRSFDKLDAPQPKSLKTPQGFTINEAPWRVRSVLSSAYYDSHRLPKDLKGLGMNGFEILGHRVVKGDLVVYLAALGTTTNARAITVVAVTDNAPVTVLASHDGWEISRMTTGVPKGGVAYVLYSDEDAPELRYGISTSKEGESKVYELPPPQGSDQKEWIGYCGTSACTSHALSPDGKWRLAASMDDSINDEGMFYFPANRPDAGINVFLRQADNSTKAQDPLFGFTRSYSWGGKDTFYFDNHGAYACIWKTDIRSKTTTRIIPVEAAVKPYYLRYAGKDFVLFSYRYHDESNKHSGSEVYLATP